MWVQLNVGVSVKANLFQTRYKPNRNPTVKPKTNLNQSHVSKQEPNPDRKTQPDTNAHAKQDPRVPKELVLSHGFSVARV